MALTRREFSLAALAVTASGNEADWLKSAPAQALDTAGNIAPQIAISRDWSGSLCSCSLKNTGSRSVRLREVVLFDAKHSFPPQTALYGEGFQMLSQTGGTLAQPVDLGGLTDRKHYRIPEPAGATTFYNVLWLSPASGRDVLLGFTSSNRFAGRFHLRSSSLQVSVDLEGLELAPGGEMKLEGFCYLTGAGRAELFERFATLLDKNHPRLKWAAPPEGWCSWYCFGPAVTAQQVRDNLNWIAKNAPFLRYVQIDDGYQSAMGDWLETGSAFGGDIRGLLKEIRQRGFEPAIWVAPFIAEKNSVLFREHPRWFMKDVDGQPLPSDRITFGGWRHGPWYALDCTQPEVQRHLTEVFRTMNREWGCTYFKLDANFWGAMHGAKLANPKATRIEAYRLGMRAILEGAGNSFILGCNHPMWPSLGLIHGARSSGDISREWGSIRSVASENLHRAWQNGRLWWNDPDALVLLGNLPENEFRFHAAATMATGGLLLSGDDLTKMPPERLALLKKLRSTGKPAVFDGDFKVGRLQQKGRELVFLLNWSDTPQSLGVALPRPVRITDLFEGKHLGRHEERYRAEAMPPRSAQILELFA